MTSLPLQATPVVGPVARRQTRNREEEKEKGKAQFMSKCWQDAMLMLVQVRHIYIISELALNVINLTLNGHWLMSPHAVELKLHE